MDYHPTHPTLQQLPPQQPQSFDDQVFASFCSPPSASFSALPSATSLPNMRMGGGAPPPTAHSGWMPPRNPTYNYAPGGSPSVTTKPYKYTKSFSHGTFSNFTKCNNNKNNDSPSATASFSSLKKSKSNNNLFDDPSKDMRRAVFCPAGEWNWEAFQSADGQQQTQQPQPIQQQQHTLDSHHQIFYPPQQQQPQHLAYSFSQQPQQPPFQEGFGSFAAFDDQTTTSSMMETMETFEHGHGHGPSSTTTDIYSSHCGSICQAMQRATLMD